MSPVTCGFSKISLTSDMSTSSLTSTSLSLHLLSPPLSDQVHTLLWASGGLRPEAEVTHMGQYPREVTPMKPHSEVKSKTNSLAGRVWER